MSLINEALKKAQKQQSEAATKDQLGASSLPPPPPPPPPGQTARDSSAEDPEPESNPVFTARRQRSDKKNPTTVILIAAIVLFGAGGGVWFMLHDGDSGSTVALADPINASEIAVAKEAAKIAVPDPVVVRPAPNDETVPSTGGSVDSTPVITLNLPTMDSADFESIEPGPVAAPVAEIPTATPPVEATPRPESRSELRSMPDVQPQIAVSTPPVATDPEPVALPTVVMPDQRPLQRTPTGKVVIAETDVPTARGMPKASAQSTVPNAAVLNFLERVRVSGIRVSDTDPKVLMNDRVYRLNEIVDRDLQLRVIEISPRELRFQDVHGHVYRKTF